MMDDSKLVLLFLQTLHYRNDLESNLFRNLRLSDGSLNFDDIDSLYGERVHTELTKSTRLVLTNFNVLTEKSGVIEVNKERLEYFIQLVNVAKASREYKWPTNRPKPFIYVSPPSLITQEFSDDVDDISNLLIKLVSSAEKQISIMSPFTNEIGLKSILNPLKACKNNPKIFLYLTAEGELQELISKQVIKQIPDRMLSNLHLYFCSSDVTDSDKLPHAKVLVVDSNKGYLGSANFTKQGLQSRFELGIELDEQQSSTVDKLLAVLVAQGMFVLSR